ncbi:MAG: hypothetical protein KKA73_02320, partial [Chloroflexi bacterium]|nr:hypothetical protein [Chloroflexota bacterium]
FFSDAPMWNGSFNLRVQGGHSYIGGLDLPPHAPYVSGLAGAGAVEPGQHVTMTVPLEAKDAVIEGHLFEVLTKVTLGDKALAGVFGRDERGHWASANVNAAGGYQMTVVSGTWHLRAWLDPATGYVASPDPVTVTVTSGQAVVQDLAVWPINALISGTVLAPDGSGLRAFVMAHGESSVAGYYETYGETKDDGSFELWVPAGTYVVGAALPDDELAARGWQNPAPIEDLTVTASTPATGLMLRFRRLDGTIHGTIVFTPGLTVTPTHSAYVWGWARNGEWAETEATPVPGTHIFTYTLRVISGTFWHVGAVYEDWDAGLYYKSRKVVVSVPSSGHAVQNLVLDGPKALPQSHVVSFDGGQMQTIVLPGDVELRIPPGALTVSGTVTLYILPTQAMRPDAGHEFIGAGYEIWAVDESGQAITQFNQNVVMTFHYSDADLAAQGISEHTLVPVYYSTLAGRWVLANSYVVNTNANQISLQFDHFSRWGVCSLTPGGITIYLPLVFRNS